MKYKFDTDQETRKRMSKVHVTEGKDEVVIRKILWDNGIHYRKTIKSCLESRILQSQNTKSPSLSMGSSGTAMIGKTTVIILRGTVTTGFLRSSII